MHVYASINTPRYTTSTTGTIKPIKTYLVGNAHHQPFNARVAVAVVTNLFRSVFHGAFGVGVGDKTKLVPTDDFHFAFLRRRARAVKDLLADPEHQ